MKGVVPDISFPDPFSRKYFGEQSYPSSLKWDVIEPVKFTKTGDLSGYIEPLKHKYLQRVNTNKEFQYLNDDYHFQAQCIQLLYRA